MATTPRASLLGRLLREPTLHFLLLAGVLFGVSSTLGERRRNLVVLDARELGARIAEVEQARGVPLDSAERRQVEEAYLDELILVEEALAMGLEDDPRIRDFLVQKMLHVLSADVIQPTAEELAAHHRANEGRYTAPARLTVDELIVAGDGPLASALAEGLERGLAPAELGAGAGGGAGLRHNVLPEVAPDDLGRLFGAATAGLILGAGEGVWVGPHPTVRGQHWFRVTARRPAALLPLETVREQVRLDWITEQEAERLERRVAELRSRYRVVVERAEGER